MGNGVSLIFLQQLSHRFRFDGRVSDIEAATGSAGEVLKVPTTANSRVPYAVQDGVAVLTIDYPPVNALGAEVRAGLLDGLARASDDAAVSCVVLRGARGSFVAGADIREFGLPPQPPSSIDVFAAIEGLKKPIVAVIEGVALGGGLELALACHFRIAAPGAKLGLPEIKLGLLPGAGGTQRLPRLIGFAAAVPMILGGEPIGAAEAAKIGLVDALGDGDMLRQAAALVRKQTAGRPPPRIRDLTAHVEAARRDLVSLDDALAGLVKRARNRRAADAAAKAVRGAATLPFADGMALERTLFLELRDSPESKAQRYLFFAERTAAKVPPKAATAEPIAVKSAAIIGAGTMGGGIAMCFAGAGIPVTLIDRDDASVKRGLDTIEGNYRKTAARGGLTGDDVTARLGLIRGSTAWDAVRTADIVVEAVFEEMPLKQEIFRKIDTLAKPGAVLATNTSTLDVDAIAAVTQRPEAVAGMHFFSPAHIMRLLEIIEGRKTDPRVLRTAVMLGKQLGKISAVVGVCDGFVGNRMALRRGSERLMQEGALPRDIDRVATEFGFAMGPCATGDLAGLDISWRIRKAKGTPAPVADWICEQGRFGQKTGKGYYRYEAGSRAPISDPEVEAFIKAKARELGHAPRDISDEEILDRQLLPMINEGARILEEKIARNASDIDVIWANGYGWPLWRGGPMYYADQVGLRVIRDKLVKYEAQLCDDRFHAARLIHELADAGKGFADLPPNDR